MAEIQYVLPKILQAELLKNNLTQTEVARRIGVSKTVLNGWLAGSMPRDLMAVARMAEVLKVSFYFMLFGTPDPFEPARDVPADLASDESGKAQAL